MLLFVPLLAGLWPGVRLMVNQYNKAAEKSTSILTEASERFESLERNLENKIAQLSKLDSTSDTMFVQANNEAAQTLTSFEAAVTSFRQTVDKFHNDYTPRTIEQTNLPWTWAIAFFAALLVVVAQTWYQLRAPEIVREQSLERFVLDRKDDFSEHPTEVALERAEEYARPRDSKSLKLQADYIKGILRDLAFADEPGRQRIVADLDRPRIKLMIQLNSGFAMRKEIGDKSHEVDSLLKKAELDIKEGRNSAVIQREMTLIERGAIIEYMVFARKNPISIIMTLILYLSSIVLISSIVWVQSRAIVNLAGWRSIKDIFYFLGF